MGNKRIKTYWLILLLVLMSVNLVLSVEPTQAHYLNTAVWNTVVEAEENAVMSKFLSKVSDAPLTVLVGEIPMEKFLLEFNLDCSRDVTGSLTWSVDHPEYVNVFMSIGDMSLVPNSEIQLEMGEHDVTMWLIPSNYARNTVHDALDINVSVNWADSLQGKFLVTLPAVTEADLAGNSTTTLDEPTTGTDDTTTTPDDSTTTPDDTTTTPDDSTTTPDNSTTDTDEPTTGTDEPTTTPEEPTTGTDDPSTDGDSDTPSNGEAEAISYVQTNVSENSANSILAQSQAKKARSNPLVLHLEATPLSVNQLGTTATKTAAVTETKPTERMTVMRLNSTVSTPTGPTPTETPTEPTPTEAPTEPASTEPAKPTTGENEASQFRLETIDGFNMGGKIPVKLYLTEDITQAYLGMGQTSDTGVTVLPFPEYTCYSLDNGESYYMLYTDKVNTIELIPGGSKVITVLLDLSRLELFDKEELTLAADGYDGTTLAQSASAKTILKEDPFFQIDSQFLTQESQATITLNENWKNYIFEYKVQMLTGETAVDPEEATEETTEETTMPEYVDVDASSWSSLTTNEENYKITLQIKDVLPQAGTYRVLMSWSKDGVCFAETQTTFFINYSVQPETDEPEATEPEATESEATEPETTEPETTEPESNEEKVPSSE